MNQYFDDPGVCLYELQPGGVWFMKGGEWGADLIATDANITAAGGVVPFCRLIVERANRALAALFGGGEVAPPKNLTEEVQNYLLSNIRVQYVNGVPRLELS